MGRPSARARLAQHGLAWDEGLDLGLLGLEALVEAVGVHLDVLLDLGAAVEGGEVAQGLEEACLRVVALLELAHLRAAHGHALRPRRVVHALAPADLLESAVLERGPPDLRLALLVALEHVHDLLLVALGLGLDLGERPVRLPEVGVPAILEFGFFGY